MGIKSKLGGVLAAGLIVCLGWGGATLAAPIEDPSSVTTGPAAANKALINPDANVRLQIHKFLGAATQGTANGTEQTINLPKLQGVNFDVYQVQKEGKNLGLSSNQSWTDAAKALEGVDLSKITFKDGVTFTGKDNATYSLKLVKTVTTGADGVAQYADDDPGIFVVNENLTTSTTITNLETNKTVDKATITASAPFLVTLPLTNPNKTEWMYDVHVYPKNQSDTADKTVVDKGTITAEGAEAGTNHTLTYTITTGITNGLWIEKEDGTMVQNIGQYQVFDNLDGRLNYTGLDVKISTSNADLTRCTTSATEGQPAPVSTTCDYEVWVSAEPAEGETDAAATFEGSTPAAGVKGANIEIRMTTGGLQKLAEAKKANTEATVITTLTTVVNQEGLDGLIPNTAQFIPNKPWSEQNPGSKIPTPTTKTYYGDINLTKQDPTSTNADMSGAEFAVYADPTPDTECTADDVKGNPLKKVTLNNNGKQPTDDGYNKVSFIGLQASNWYDNAEVTDTVKMQMYCVVETKAPAGYNLDATAHQFKIDYKTAKATTADANGNPAFTTGTINNEKDNLTHHLPLTGGQGIALVSIAGMILIVGGLLYYSKSSRKQRA